MAIDMGDLRAHLNITFGDDDLLLSRLHVAAERHVEGVLGFKLDDPVEFPDGPPEDVEQAILMLVAHWYENREETITGTIVARTPVGVADLLANHRNYTYG